MADRLGAESELADIRRQVAEVQKKSKKRLGKNYNLLMGQKHKFDSFDRKLIEKYVCMGEDEEAQQGRFADVTRSADLYMDNPSFPIPITFRDTPGVNDPFLMREQVTLRTLGDSSISVMVLSANQALNSVDLALVQILSASSRGRLVIFVNRVDDLADPVREIEEIRKSLGERLEAEGVGDESLIIFGSAAWAEAALLHCANDLPEESRAAMEVLRQAKSISSEMTLDDVAWNLSAVPELRETIGRLVADGCGRRQLNVARRDLQDAIAHSLMRVQGIRNLANGAHAIQLTEKEVHARISELCRSIASDFGDRLHELSEKTARSLHRSAVKFVDMATEAILQELSEKRSDEVTCDPNMFRRRLKKTYIHFATANQEIVSEVLASVAEKFEQLIREILGPNAELVAITPPAPPDIEPPVALGRTIIVDLHVQRGTRFIRKFFKSHNEEARIKKCVAMEVDSLISDVIENHVDADFKRAEDLFRTFINQQTRAVLRLCDHSQGLDGEAISTLGLDQRLAEAKRAQAIATELEKALQSPDLATELTKNYRYAG